MWRFSEKCMSQRGFVHVVFCELAEWVNDAAMWRDMVQNATRHELLGIPSIVIFIHLVSSVSSESWATQIYMEVKKHVLTPAPVFAPLFISVCSDELRECQWHQRHNLAFYQCNSNIRLFVIQQGQTLAQRVHLVLSCYAWLGETRVHDGCLCILFKMLFSPFCAKYAKQVAIWSQISFEITPMLNALGPLRSRKWMKQDPQRERPTFYLLNKP